MSPQVDLDADVMDYLKSQAEPFVDTPSTVLRRLLGIATAETRAPDPPTARQNTVIRSKKRAPSKNPTSRTRAPSGTLLPEDRYELPLLRALAEAGGQAPYRDVVDMVGRELKDALMPADFENLTSGAIRWQSRLQFVRLRLIERGYLDRNMPRGIWGITELGRAALARGGES